jgi:hypothetical protein
MRRAARRALEEMRGILEASGASLRAVDTERLDALERGWMRRVRELVASARLVGVPDSIDANWHAYARAYCAYLVASGTLAAPSTIFVSVGADGAAVQTRLLRLDERGEVVLIH